MNDNIANSCNAQSALDVNFPMLLSMLCNSH